MTRLVSGRLRPSSGAPAVGEHSEEIAQLGGVVVEHIVSGVVAGPVDYDQEHDEWVVLLNGGATLEVGEERLELAAGDWVVLPAHVRHRLVETEPGSTWLALHARG